MTQTNQLPVHGANPAATASGSISDSGNDAKHHLSSSDLLVALQQRYALINMEGKIWVVDIASLTARAGDGTAMKLVLSNRNDGALLLHRLAKARCTNVDVTEVVKEFFVSPQTTYYVGVDFNPAPAPGNRLNLWVGPTIVAQAGQWPLTQSFLLDVICAGDRKSFDYLIRFIAHALQRPEEKPGILLVLLGGQGTGKGTLGRILRLIWSATYLQVHNIDAVTGSFNAALERAFIVFMDEALFVGDRKASDALKSLVTEPVININEKYQPARQTHSYHRFVAATNADHLKNTERDDRRDFVLRVSDSRKGDHAYWQALNHEIEQGGVAAMTHTLMTMDLSDFNVRQKPDTKELLEQKLLSLSHIPRWWYDCLSGGGVTTEGDWDDFVSTEDAIDGIVGLAGGKLHRKPSPSDVVQAFKTFCPSAVKKQQQRDFGRHRGLSLPTLPQARAEFEQYIGGAINWGSDEASMSHDAVAGAASGEADY